MENDMEMEMEIDIEEVNKQLRENRMGEDEEYDCEYESFVKSEFMMMMNNLEFYLKSNKDDDDKYVLAINYFIELLESKWWYTNDQYERDIGLLISTNYMDDVLDVVRFVLSYSN
jgi:hypothetical protein